MISELSPDIREVPIGTRSLKMIQIYPLSVGDQIKMTDILAAVAAEVLAANDTTEDTIAIRLVPMVSSNLKEFLSFVIDEEVDIDDVLYDMTNNQLINLVQVIFEVNYESVSKNAKGLFKTFQTKFLNLTQSSRPLSQEQVTELKTSSNEVNTEE
jgi:hypothetical protein